MHVAIDLRPPVEVDAGAALQRQERIGREAVVALDRNPHPLAEIAPGNVGKDEPILQAAERIRLDFIVEPEGHHGIPQRRQLGIGGGSLAETDRGVDRAVVPPYAHQGQGDQDDAGAPGGDPAEKPALVPLPERIILHPEQLGNQLDESPLPVEPRPEIDLLMDIGAEDFRQPQRLHDGIKALRSRVPAVRHAVDDEEMDLLRPPQRMEEGDFPAHPLRPRRMRRADDDQVAAGAQPVLELLRQAARLDVQRREEDRPERLAAQAVLVAERRREAVAFQLPLECLAPLHVLGIEADEGEMFVFLGHCAAVSAEMSSSILAMRDCRSRTLGCSGSNSC